MIRSPLPRSRNAAASLLAAVALLGVGPRAALGHAEPLAVTPADGAEVASPPTEIVITFTESLDPGRSSIRLVDAGGIVVAEGGRIDPGDDANTMRLALASSLGPGRYTVRWTSLSTEDSEQARGTTTFVVATATSPPPTTDPRGSAAGAPSGTPPTAAASTTPAASASAAPEASSGSLADAVFPIVAVLVLVAALGARLLRGRSRGAG